MAVLVRPDRDRCLHLFHPRQKTTTAPELADQIERLVNGTSYGWDVDDYDSPLRDTRLKDLRNESYRTGGMPEDWPGLDEETKNKLREIAKKVRELDESPE